MRIDFHVHTRHSKDSLTRPKDLAAKSKRLGIIPGIADHNSVGAHAEMRALKADFIPGEEIFTDKGDLIGLYITERIEKRTPFLEAIDLIHSQGGLAYLPHMFDYGRANAHASEAEASKADIVETFNARCLDQSFNRRAAQFAELHKLPAAAGSDSHFLWEFGHTWTELPDFDISSPKALMRSLGKARLHTKPAPFYARGTTTILALGKRLLGGRSPKSI